MRLNPFNTDNIDVRGGGGSRFPGGGAGQLGCGTIIIAGIVSLLFGTDLGQTIAVFDSVDQATNGGQVANSQGKMSEEELCSSSQYATEACNALQSLNKTWEPVFAQANVGFEQPFLYLFSGKYFNVILTTPLSVSNLVPLSNFGIRARH